ncbi:hypothetical protein CTRI78_v010477 [Colletotrichum trifolii]|uniref:Uncharacterized protein n=1 Tax=Colletotrichum trifolii TaxID=5466 RepID=A0A4R8QU88_COLTR|nr:hypothetical protein CTRI78_v010477 [Colletotrichum trifolii]
MVSKLVALSAIITSLLISQAAAAGGWDALGCTQVSFDTLLAVKNGDDTVVGPKGVYATTADSQCVYVDASAGGAFATEHAAEHAWFVDVARATGAGGLDFLSTSSARAAAAAPRESLEKRQANCGEICNSSQTSAKTCNSCGCRYDTTTCAGTWCVAYYRCK